MPSKMSKFSVPLQITERVAQLGNRIRTARIRRGWSVADLADKAGINRNTLTALELGKLGTTVGVYFTILWALGLDKSLDNIADPDTDLHGKALEASHRPKRAGKAVKAGDDYDF
jgi:transcriptional regulator with XRE-family HTH domain